MMIDAKMFEIPNVVRSDGSPRMGRISRRALEKLDRNSVHELDDIFASNTARIVHIAQARALFKPGDGIIALDMFDV